MKYELRLAARLCAAVLAVTAATTLNASQPPGESLSLQSDDAYIRYNAMGMLESG